MNLTKSLLKQIIKEELQNVLKEGKFRAWAGKKIAGDAGEKKKPEKWRKSRRNRPTSSHTAAYGATTSRGGKFAAMLKDIAQDVKTERFMSWEDIKRRGISKEDAYAGAERLHGHEHYIQVGKKGVQFYNPEYQKTL